MADEQALNKKLSEEEKHVLIGFYEVNEPLWSSDSKFKDKEDKTTTKDEMVKLFNHKYSIDLLEKTFHSLRTAFVRECKKVVAGQDPKKKKWKFYENLEFLKKEIDKPKKPQFDVDERELLIDFYKSHPSLWNHNITEYRDRNLRDALLDKLVVELGNKFKKEHIKLEWHSLQVSYRRERSREEGSKTSGSGCAEVYISDWEHFNQMQFLDDIANIDDSYSTLDTQPYTAPAKKKKKEKDEESVAKAQLWKTLAQSLKSNNPKESHSEPKQVNTLNEKASLFGQVVADTLLQYDIKEWVYLKKKILGVFFDYDQQKAGSWPRFMTSSAPHSHSPSAPQEPNGQSHYMNMLLSNQLHYNGQDSSNSQNFQPFSPASTDSQGI